MKGLGTIINVAGVLIGGLCGLLFGKRLAERFQETLMSAVGICVLFLGISGCLEEMFVITADGLKSSGSMMMIGCFAIGALLGEWLKRKTGSDGDNRFVDGFVTTSLTICIGAMAVVGSIQDGISGNYSTLAAKAALDLIIVLIMTASMGKGCIFSAIPVALFQGSITLLAGLIEPLMTDQSLSNLSLTGNMLIFCVGVNLIWGKKIKVANLLPAIFLAAAWAFLP